jgi:hypothetical protein
MTPLTYILPVLLVALGALFASRFRMMKAAAAGGFPVPAAERYRPMARLLQADEFAFAQGNKALERRLRRQRYHIFRGYLRCLARDYGQLLGAIRMVMVQSSKDRSEVARVLTQSEVSFAFALCRVEFRLAFYRMGMGQVEVRHLVQAVEALRATHVGLLVPAGAAA